MKSGLVIEMNSEVNGEFPFEKIYPIKDNPKLVVRLTVGKSIDKFWVESDIVTSEGGKIIYHLGVRQNIDSIFDAVQVGLNFYHFSGK